MSRSIELGRAVIGCQTAHLQLWLTTLITISPQHQTTNHEQLTSRHLLEYLLSQEVWIGRGNGLHMQLALTVHGEPLNSEQVDKLAARLVNAPVWRQLRLNATLPHSFNDHNGRDRGSIRLEVDHIRDYSSDTQDRRHRILSDVPFADTQPPEGVPSMTLDSVSLQMEVVAMIPRTKGRATGLRTMNINGQSSIRDEVTPQVENSHNNLNDQETGESVLDASIESMPRAVPRAVDKKRKSTAEQRRIPFGTPDSPVESTKRLKGIGSFHMRTNYAEHDVHRLVDAAMRTSFGSGTSKLVQDIKLLTSTFTGGLTDIAPALFSVDYFVALSQRARLIPTIGRSLSRIQFRTPLSMGQNTTILDSGVQTPSTMHSRADLHQGWGRHAGLTLEARLWMHSQKRIPTKGKVVLQSFIDHTENSLPCDLIPDDLEAEIGTIPLNTRRELVELSQDNDLLYIDERIPAGNDSILPCECHTTEPTVIDLLLDEEEDLLFNQFHAKLCASDQAAINGSTDEINQSIMLCDSFNLNEHISEERDDLLFRSDGSCV